MNENENNFESLRRALALKRHEIPPPGYFHNFSGKVIARIRSGEGRSRQTFSEQLSGHAPWLIKFLKSFDAKPAFAGAFASSLCLLLLFGIIYAEQPESADVSPSLLPVASSQPIAPLASAVSSTALMPVANSVGLVASTNPITSLQPVASLFGQQNPFAQQVNFSVPGN